MEALRITKPMKDNLEYLSEEIDTSKYKKIRISSYADTILQINLEWSLEESEGIPPYKMSTRTPSKMWKSDIYDSVFPRLRIRLVNQSGHDNSELIVRVSGEPYKLAPIDRPDENYEDKIPPTPIRISRSTGGGIFEDDRTICDRTSGPVDSEMSESSRLEPHLDGSKKKKLFSFKKSAHKPLHDERLPGHIPKDALIVGGYYNKMKIIPAGLPGEVLTMTVDGPAWIHQYPPKHLSDESKKKMKESKEISWEV
jgi:hypothetical protein